MTSANLSHGAPRGVIFDMDGLMLETERPLIPVWIRAGEIFGQDISEDLVIRTLGLNENDIRDLCIRELGPEFPYSAFRDLLHRLFHEEFEKGIALKPGLEKLLDYLSASAIPVIVATSSKRNSALWKLEIAGIRDRFDKLVCGDEIKNGKPFPDIFLKAAETLGFPPRLCVGFEDSPAGLKALAAAGIPSVFIRDIIEPPGDILATVWKRFDRLDQAISLFE